MLLQFGKEVRVESAVHAKLLAFRKGILVAATFRWTSSHPFVFQLDTKSVIAWNANPSLESWRFQNILHECYFFRSRISCSLTHINQSRNDVADVLARMSLVE